MDIRRIRNIYCVGRNYGQHAAELGNSVPEEPMIFLKPTHAAIVMDGTAVELPGDRGALHYEAELVLHIGRDYIPGHTVDELVDAVSLGIDFTLRDVQNVIKSKGYPWLPAKGFLRSAVITPAFAFPGAQAVSTTPFSLRRNGQQVQRGDASQMIFPLQTLVDYIAAHYGLGAGDLIYTGTPAGVAAVMHDDRFELLWDDQVVGAFTAKLGAAGS
ncbi:2-keto-4-pentenoate hydratase/2-oxohepta-3-ene-1,7-dioic acid hydratase (catechol pathway) [Paenibacillus sp. UNCCL117]|uniref:fumarylacetoacetate hydrolase family protein n=1 Tax=unclassified Paenibacillus TaxID=185978 RepID=UPI00088FE795|nr:MULTISPECIES: fumarylacetoacetate hydrolase family protein [unclassified Paenibacillus]SDC20753.1 2-keto-4-pentenoate hydratase/2-oxohepta-3-ene-1,7-dioic acid hydratase (catechol pathway) [Paenibacillus sp. cl123]SFW18684.1 2-keto-4-pentenoate hydratase/2-oxohepta-3-ene-1,7-dioic acid hydratase (catechol pathway) [Paenibacillus sp. UNCCL117]